MCRKRCPLGKRGCLPLPSGHGAPGLSHETTEQLTLGPGTQARQPCSRPTEVGTAWPVCMQLVTLKVLEFDDQGAFSSRTCSKWWEDEIRRKARNARKKDLLGLRLPLSNHAPPSLNSQSLLIQKLHFSLSPGPPTLPCGGHLPGVGRCSGL